MCTTVIHDVGVHMDPNIMNVYFENWEGRGRGLKVTMSGLVYLLVSDKLIKNFLMFTMPM